VEDDGAAAIETFGFVWRRVDHDPVVGLVVVGSGDPQAALGAVEVAEAPFVIALGRHPVEQLAQLAGAAPVREHPHPDHVAVHRAILSASAGTGGRPTSDPSG
jgi:hypothetical protein